MLNVDVDSDDDPDGAIKCVNLGVSLLNLGTV